MEQRKKIVRGKFKMKATAKKKAEGFGCVRLYASTSHRWNTVRNTLQMTHDDFASYLLGLHDQLIPEAPDASIDEISVEYLPPNFPQLPIRTPSTSFRVPETFTATPQQQSTNRVETPRQLRTLAERVSFTPLKSLSEMQQSTPHVRHELPSNSIQICSFAAFETNNFVTLSGFLAGSLLY